MDAGDTTTRRSARRDRRRTRFIVGVATVTGFIVAAGATVLLLRAFRVREAVRAIEAAGGVVAWDHELAIVTDDSLSAEKRGEAWNAVLERHQGVDRGDRGWLDRLLGPEWLHDVAGVYFFPGFEARGSPGSPTSLEETFAAHLSAFPRLKLLLVLEREVTDRTLEIIGGLGELERLTVHGAGMTDEGLRHLRGLSRLRHLELTGSRFSDAGLRHLKALGSLESCAIPVMRIPQSSGESLGDKRRRLEAGQ
jgi:hypothetical protein